jgi:hypothetical protein
MESKHVKEKVHIDEKIIDIVPTNQIDLKQITYDQMIPNIPPYKEADLKEIYFGRLVGARSGDKGGCANLGVWSKTEHAYSFLYHYLTVDRLKELLPDLKNYEIDRYEFPNMNAVNFYVHGILGDGASSNTRLDALAKSLGEYLRAKKVKVPKYILEES